MRKWYVSPTGTGNGFSATSSMSLTDLHVKSRNDKLRNGEIVFFLSGTYTFSCDLNHHLTFKPYVSSDRGVIFDTSGGYAFKFKKGVDIEGGSSFIFKGGPTALIFEYSTKTHKEALKNNKHSNIKNVVFYGDGTRGDRDAILVYEDVFSGQNILNISFCTFYNHSSPIKGYKLKKAIIGFTGCILNFLRNVVEFGTKITKTTSSQIDDRYKHYNFSSCCYHNIINGDRVSALLGGNNFNGDPKFIDPSTYNFNITKFISPCINVIDYPGYWQMKGVLNRTDKLDIGAYGGLLGYDHEEGPYTSNFEARLLNPNPSHAYDDLQKSSPESEDTPGRDYKTYREGGGAIPHNIIGNKATSCFPIGETDDIDRFTPAWVDKNQFNIKLTLDDDSWIDFVNGGGTLTPEFAFRKLNHLPYYTSNSDISNTLYKYYPNGAPETPTGAGGGGLNWYGWQDFKSSGNTIDTVETSGPYAGKLTLISDKIDTLNGVTSISYGIYVVYVRVTLSKDGYTGELNSWFMYKYSSAIPTCSISAVDTFGTIIRTGTYDFLIDQSGSSIPIDKYKAWVEFDIPNGSGGSTTMSKYKSIKNRKMGTPVPFKEPIHFNKENVTYTPKTMIRSLSGVWSTEASTTSATTIFKKPEPPIVDATLDYNIDGNAGKFKVWDNRSVGSYNYYPVDSNTKLIMSLYDGNSLVTQTQLTPRREYTGHGRGINSNRLNMVWVSDGILNHTKLGNGDYSWTIAHVNRLGISSVSDPAIYKRPDSSGINWTRGKITEKNLVTIPSDISDRKRIAVNVGEVDAIERIYASTSVAYSTTHKYPKAIYKVSLSVSEQLVDRITRMNLGDIKYEVSFDKSTYHLINPLERDDDPGVSKILTINGGLTKEQMILSGYPESSYINVNYDPREVILRITLIRGELPNLTPKLFSYGIKVLTRDVLRRQP